MLYVENCTSAERETIEKHFLGSSVKMEQALFMLDEIYENDFGVLNPHITDEEAKRIDTMIAIAIDLLQDCIDHYYLTVNEPQEGQGAYRNHLSTESAKAILNNKNI